MQFALVKVEIARIKHRAQPFVRNIISNAVAQQSLNRFPLSSRNIWFMPVPRFTISTVIDTEADLKLAIYSGNLGHGVKCFFHIYPEGFVSMVSSRKF